MITLEKIKILRAIYSKSYQSFNSQILGKIYDKADQEAVFNIDYVKQFEDEFYDVIHNNLSKRKNLKGYIDRVYYNEIVWLYLIFERLGDFYKVRSNKDISQLVIGEDELYNNIRAHNSKLRVLADIIYSEAVKQGFNLKHYLQISLTKTDNDEGYNLHGQYISLFPSSKRRTNIISKSSSLKDILVDSNDYQLLIDTLIDEGTITRAGTVFHFVNSKLARARFHGLVKQIHKKQYLKLFPSTKKLLKIAVDEFNVNTDSHRSFEREPASIHIEEFDFLPVKAKK